MHTVNDKRNKTLITIMLLILVGAFAYSHLKLASKRFVDFDSGWHATMAKNLAVGEGYASSYHEKRFFDHEVTTGPTLIVPLSLVIRASGTSYDLPYTFSAVFNSLLLLAALLLLHKSFNRPGNWLVFSLLATGFVYLYEPLWWVKFTADIPVLLLCLISAALLNYQHRSLQVLAGVVCGLALLAKIFAAFYLAAVLFYFLLIGRDIKTLGIFLAGLVAPLFIWMAYKAGVPAETQSFEQKFEFLKTRAAFGIGFYLEADSYGQALNKSFITSHKVLVTILKDYGLHYVSYYILIALNIFSAGYSAYAVRQGHENFKSVFCFNLFSLVIWCWYFFLCFSPSSKYSLYPIITGMLALMLFFMANRSRVNVVAVVMLVVFVVFLPGSLKTHAKDRAWGSLGDDPYKVSYMATKQFMDKTTFKKPLMSCGSLTAPWVMEFNSEGVLNFKDCYRVIKNSENHKEHFVLFVDKPLWLAKTDDSEKNILLMSYCDRVSPVMDNNYYALLNCSVDVERFNQGLSKAARTFKAAGDK